MAALILSGSIVFVAVLFYLHYSDRAIELRHGALVRSVCYSNDSTLLASVAEEVERPEKRLCTVKVWNLNTNPDAITSIHTYIPQIMGKVVTLSASDRTIAIGGYGGIVLMTGPAYKLARRLGDELDTFVEVDALSFSPDGEVLASGGYDRKHQIGAIDLWSVSTGQRLRRVTVQHAVSAIALAEDKCTVAIGDIDGNVIVWNVAHDHDMTGRTLGRQKTAVNFLSLSSDGKTVLTHSKEGLKVWDTESVRVSRTLRNGGNVAAVSSDGKMMAVDGFGDPFGSRISWVQLWNLLRGNVQQSLKWTSWWDSWQEGVENRVYSIAFSPDAKMLAVAGEEKKSKRADWHGFIKVMFLRAS